MPATTTDYPTTCFASINLEYLNCEGSAGNLRDVNQYSHKSNGTFNKRVTDWLINQGLALVSIGISRAEALDQEVQAEQMVGELVTEDEEQGGVNEVKE